MSHIISWERLSVSDYDHALIVEDNADIKSHVKLGELKFPIDFDIVWCNERTCFPSNSNEEIRAISSIIPFLAENDAAPGTDGYILSKNGANKLLQWVLIDSLFTHVDLRLMAYSLSKEEAQPLKLATSRSAQNIGHLRETYPTDHKLIAYSLRDPICSRAALSSVRAKEDEIARSGM